MKLTDKRDYLEEYERARHRGDTYFPEYALRDLSVGLALLLLLMVVSALFGAPLDERADPASTDYVPRPEWYFFFVFQLLKYFSGDMEVIGIVVIPILGVLFLTLLPFLDRSRQRHFRRRPVVTGATVIMLASVLVLTVIAVVEAPPRADASDLTFAAAGIDGHGLFITSCAHCHGDVGEGAPNPAQPGDIIPPISTAEYLASRADDAIRTVVAAGLPAAGMAAFEVTHGGPLHAEEVDAIVAHIRSWESDPPVQLDGSVSAAALSTNAEFLYPELCAGCHGLAGEGASGTALADPGYQEAHDDRQIFDSINLGHAATAMIAWGSVLSHSQITGLVDHIRVLGGAEPAGTAATGTPRYNVDVLPIFEVRCVACHGAAGGWDATTWAGAVESGNHAPVLIPGDPDNSILVQMMSGTHTDGILMPPDGKLPNALIQLVVDWIEGGALE